MTCDASLPPPCPDDAQMMEWAATLLLTMMAAATTKRIEPLEWWPRAKKALEVGAQSAETFPRMVDVMGASLEIDCLYLAQARGVVALAQTLRDDLVFGRFRLFCERHALFITALAQCQRDEQRQHEAKEDFEAACAEVVQIVQEETRDVQHV